MTIIITRQDVVGRKFSDTMNCALASVVSNKLGKKVCVGTISIGVKENGMTRNIGSINPPFEKLDFDRLYNGEIDEFRTELTLK